MMKLIAAALVTMSLLVSQSGSRPAEAGTPAQCFPSYQLCTSECMDMVGNAKGACLRACKADYNECLAS
jgi:hypothetical protein